MLTAPNLSLQSLVFWDRLTVSGSTPLLMSATCICALVHLPASNLTTQLRTQGRTRLRLSLQRWSPVLTQRSLTACDHFIQTHFPCCQDSTGVIAGYFRDKKTAGFGSLIIIRKCFNATCWQRVEFKVLPWCLSNNKREEGKQRSRALPLLILQTEEGGRCAAGKQASGLHLNKTHL